MGLTPITLPLCVEFLRNPEGIPAHRPQFGIVGCRDNFRGTIHELVRSNLSPEYLDWIDAYAPSARFSWDSVRLCEPDAILFAYKMRWPTTRPKPYD